MMQQFTEGIEKVYSDLDGMDDLKSKLHVETAVPDKVEGEPWVHSDDDFLFFLDWLVKKEWTGQQIADVVREPHHYSKYYKDFLTQRDRTKLDPYL